jgi:hypothetical protein
MRDFGTGKWRDPDSNRGHPRFSVVEQNLSNRRENPAIQRVLRIDLCEADLRKLRSFAADLGTETRSGAQSGRSTGRGEGAFSDDNQLDRGASVLQAFSNVSDHARVAALTATHH